MAEGVAAWSELTAKFAERARLDAEIVRLVGRVQRSGTIETVEGMTLDAALVVTQQMPAAGSAMLLTASDVLAHMPATMRMLEDRQLSWGQVRAIVAEARRLNDA